MNGCHSIGSCNNVCLTELVALWARKEIEQSREEEMTCSFDPWLRWIANILVMGRHTRYLMECLNVKQESHQANVMLIPEDTSCYCCGKLKKLSESNQEASLTTVRQVIIKLYSRLFRYQIWNLQSGQPLLHDVFSQDAQFDSFTYFCHVASAFDKCGRFAQCSGVDEALSVCNIAVVTAVDRLLNMTDLHMIHKWPAKLKSDWKGFDKALFCASLKSDFVEHFPRGFLDLFGKPVSFFLSPEKEWMVKFGSSRSEIKLLQREFKWSIPEIPARKSIV